MWQLLAAAGKNAVAGIHSTCANLGGVACDLDTYRWISGSPLQVVLAANQAVQVTASTTLKSDAQIWIAVGICAESQDYVPDTMTARGGGVGAAGKAEPILGHVDATAIPEPVPYTAIPVSLTRVITAKALGGAGIYNVGMCYSADGPDGGSDQTGTSSSANITTVILTTR